jgi:hypothetical protein
MGQGSADQASPIPPANRRARRLTPIGTRRHTRVLPGEAVVGQAGGGEFSTRSSQAARAGVPAPSGTDDGVVCVPGKPRTDSLCMRVRPHFHATSIPLGFPPNEREESSCDAGISWRGWDLWRRGRSRRGRSSRQCLWWDLSVQARRKRAPACWQRSERA